MMFDPHHRSGAGDIGRPAWIRLTSTPYRQDSAIVTASVSPAMQSDMSAFIGLDEAHNIMSTDGACNGR